MGENSRGIWAKVGGMDNNAGDRINCGEAEKKYED